MTILRLSKRTLFIIVLVVLGFATAFYEPVAAQKANDYFTSSKSAPLIQKSNWQQAREYSTPESMDKMTLIQPGSAKPANLTPEMVAFFERRTHEHIDRVARNLTVLAKSGYPKKIVSRGKIHDASKFASPERVPYIWLTEFHRRRQTGEAFTYPAGVEEQVKAAIQHHFTTNRHHPEFHAEPDAMSNVDIIEMVCDWTAIAQERGENGGSARQWADNNVGDQKRFKFSKSKTQFIYRVIDDLDRGLIGIEPEVIEGHRIVSYEQIFNSTYTDFNSDTNSYQYCNICYFSIGAW